MTIVRLGAVHLQWQLLVEWEDDELEVSHDNAGEKYRPDRKISDMNFKA